MSVDLSRIRLVAFREWSQRIRQRSFIVTTILMTVAVLVAVVAPVVISSAFGDDDDAAGAASVRVINTTDDASVLDRLTGHITRIGQEGQVAFSEAPAESEPAALLEEDNVNGVLTVERNSSGALAFTYTNDNGEYDQAATTTYSAIANLSLVNNLQQAGVEGQEAERVLSPPPVTIESAEGNVAETEDTEQGFRYAVAYGSALVMYMVVLIYGMWVAQGVVEEKSSRIMEIMINAATPNELMFGKIIGVGVAGLTQLLPMLLAAGIGLLSQQWLADTLDASGIDFTGIDFGAISATLIIFFLVYFLFGFLLYAALYAGVGSLVSRQEDVQTVMTPMTLAVIVGFFGAIFTLNAPDSVAAQVISIVPLTSPMAMVPRILLGDPAVWEIALSIALLAVAGYLAALLAGRIYRMGVLMYGQNPSLKVIFQRDRISAAR